MSLIDLICLVNIDFVYFNDDDFSDLSSVTVINYLLLFRQLLFNIMTF